MPVQHWLRITKPDGTQPQIIAQNPVGSDMTTSGFANLAYTNVLNGVGTCKFSVHGNHVMLNNFPDWSMVEVYRQWTEKGIAPYIAWSGFFRDEQSSLTTAGGDLFTAMCYSDNYLLGTRIVAYPSGKANYTKFTSVAAETILKTLVKYNCVATFATVANGRDEDGTITGLTVDTDAATGTVMDWANANANLLQDLQKLCTTTNGNIDFSVLKTPGAATWLLKVGCWNNPTSPVQSTDRTATVKFSLELGNMVNPVYQNIRNAEKNIAIGKSTGSGTTRPVTIYGAVSPGVPSNELYVSLTSQATTAAAINAQLSAALLTNSAKETITFDALPLPVNVYGRDWWLGDKIAVKYKSHTITPRVVMVTTVVDVNQGEMITPTLATNV